MTPSDAVLAVLGEADEPLHWTVIQDRALRAGYLDPFESWSPHSESAIATGPGAD